MFGEKLELFHLVFGGQSLLNRRIGCTFALFLKFLYHGLTKASENTLRTRSALRFGSMLRAGPSVLEEKDGHVESEIKIQRMNL